MLNLCIFVWFFFILMYFIPEPIPKHLPYRSSTCSSYSLLAIRIYRCAENFCVAQVVQKELGIQNSIKTYNHMAFYSYRASRIEEQRKRLYTAQNRKRRNKQNGEEDRNAKKEQRKQSLCFIFRLLHPCWPRHYILSLG